MMYLSGISVLQMAQQKFCGRAGMAYYNACTDVLCILLRTMINNDYRQVVLYGASTKK